MRSEIMVTPEVYGQILDHLRNTKKIKAIKVLRDAAGVGLKEAKLAIDRLAIENSSMPYEGEPNTDAPFLHCQPKIVEVTVDYGVGPIKVNLEQMQITVLTQLHTIGIDAVADTLDLIEVLTALNDNRKVIVTDEKVR